MKNINFKPAFKPILSNDTSGIFIETVSRCSTGHHQQRINNHRHAIVEG